MIKKPTNELMETLNASSNIDRYLKDEADSLIDSPLFTYLNQLADEKNIKKSQAIKNAELNEIYGYQIFSGKRFPSRDKLITLAFGMGLSLEETQQLLKYGGFAALYPKNKRDSIIIWCIRNALSLCRTNEELYTHSYETL